MAYKDNNATLLTFKNVKKHWLKTSVSLDLRYPIPVPSIKMTDRLNILSSCQFQFILYAIPL